MTSVAIAPEMSALKTRLKSIWMDGDYDTFSRYMQKGAETFFERLKVGPEARLLDVACGSGQLALIAARAGVTATGCDLAPNWVVKARERADAEGLSVNFDEADAEQLPYEDGRFDVVTSVVGAMFAPRPTLVAAEMARVCKPGGTIAMVNWTAAGFIGQMFKAIAAHIKPSGMPSPLLWGDEATVRERFQPHSAGIQCSKQLYPFVYPFPPAAVVEFFRQFYGPMSQAFAGLDEEGQTALRNDLEKLWTAHNKATDGTTSVHAEYLEVIAIRG